MATDPTVVIPWRPGCPHRDVALSWSIGRWSRLGWTVIVGEHRDGPWCKAAAVAAGLEQRRSDVIVIADADVWCDDIGDAVDAVYDHGWAVPHLKVRRLRPEPTAEVLAGADFDVRMPLTQPAYRGRAGGGLVAIARDVYDQVPLDPRFVGWGQEDESWDHALRCLVGDPWRRSPADLWHLWHPPQQRMSRVFGSPESRALFYRYQRARRRPDVMAELIEEAHRATPVRASGHDHPPR